MKDAIVIAIVVGFFALCAAYVTWCERVLAADAPDRLAQRGTADATSADAVAQVAAPVGAAVVAADVRGDRDARRQ